MWAATIVGGGTGCPVSMSPSMWKVMASRIKAHALDFGVGGHDAGQVGAPGAVTGRPLLNHDHIIGAHVCPSFPLWEQPACRKILRAVPGGRSMDGFPAMVTMPGLSGCAY